MGGPSRLTAMAFRLPRKSSIVRKNQPCQQGSARTSTPPGGTSRKSTPAK